MSLCAHFQHFTCSSRLNLLKLRFSSNTLVNVSFLRFSTQCLKNNENFRLEATTTEGCVITFSRVDLINDWHENWASVISQQLSTTISHTFACSQYLSLLELSFSTNSPVDVSCLEICAAFVSKMIKTFVWKHRIRGSNKSSRFSIQVYIQERVSIVQHLWCAWC